MLGNRRWRELQQLDDLADAELAARQRQERPHAALVRQRVRNGKHLTHMSPMVISPCDEV